MQIVSWGDILYEISNPIFWEELEKRLKMFSAEICTQPAIH